MHITNITPVFAVKDIAKSRNFYQDVFEFEVVYQNDWYVHLRAGNEQKAELGFVASHHPSQPAIFQKLYMGEGAFLSLEVDDVDAEYKRLKEKGIAIKLEKRDEPWGERHFAVEDPNGVVLNISKTDRDAREKVSMKEHMMQKDK
jgi:catechol 2,3-dioxygenase-like lactoylglutathione lyase family enzyme